MAKIQTRIETLHRSFAPLAKQSLTVLWVSVFVAAGLSFAAVSGANAAAVGTPALKSVAQGQAFGTPMPKIAGTVLGADHAQVFIDGMLNGIALVTGGAFSYYPFLPLSSGSHTVHLRAADSKSGVAGAYSDVVSLNIIPNPAPTLLAPQRGVRLGQDRVWVGGVARNGSLIRILVDQKEVARTRVRSHASGVGSFGVQLADSALGEHVVNAIARDSQGTRAPER